MKQHYSGLNMVFENVYLDPGRQKSQCLCAAELLYCNIFSLGEA